MHLGHLFTGKQLITATGWLVEEAQSSADATAQASSTLLPSAKRPKLAPPGTDDSSVMNALGPLLNAGTSSRRHQPSPARLSAILRSIQHQLLHRQLIGGVKMNRAFLVSRVSPSPRGFRPKMAWCLHIFALHFYFFASVHYVHLHNDIIRSSAINLHLTFDLGFAHHRCPYSAVCGRQ